MWPSIHMMILWLAVYFLLLAIATEAVSEILTTAEITAPLRNAIAKWVFDPNNPPADTYYQAFKVWVHKLSKCGYCTSVWVAAAACFWFPVLLWSDLNAFVNWILATTIT